VGHNNGGGEIMKTFEAWIIHKQYFKVEVEAEDWESAREDLFQMELPKRKPDDLDFEIYDLKEKDYHAI
jgi:hypothetical protein